jgi:hypothetical protein
MPFIGNKPALSYTSFAKQDFTTSVTTSYTLDNPVANANELALFINFVRQEPTTAYSASGTSLTLTSATSASDDMYCVFLGKAVQTVNPPNGSVGTAQLANSAVSTVKIADDAVTETKLSALANPFASQLLHVRDEKSSGTDGGSTSAGDNTCVLNTIKTNEITGASLGSNQITLPAGTYYIDASVLGFFVNRFRGFFRNITDSSDTVLGQAGYSAGGSGSDQSVSKVCGRFTIASQKVFEMKLFCQSARVSNGFGVDTSDSRTNVYTDVQIWRTA